MHETGVGSRAGRTDELLERSAALGALAVELDAVSTAGGGRVVVLAGEAGIGKTSLLRGFRSLHAEQPRFFWGACDPLFTPRPLGPFSDVAEQAAGELRDLVREGAKPYDIAGALLRELSRRPTVLVLEDLHWADEASLDVVRLLTHRIETVPTLVVGSYRDDDVPRGHPFRTVLGELGREERVTRLRLDRLSRGSGFAARRTAPCRPRRALPNDRRQPVLRHRGARGERGGGPRDGAGCGARAREPSDAVGPEAARGGGDRLAAHRVVATRRTCAGRHRRARCLPGSRRADGGRRNGRLPARSRSARGGELHRAEAAQDAASRCACGARGPERRTCATSRGWRITPMRLETLNRSSGLHRRPPSARRLSGRTAKPPPSTSVRFATPTACRPTSWRTCSTGARRNWSSSGARRRRSSCAGARSRSTARPDRSCARAISSARSRGRCGWLGATPKPRRRASMRSRCSSNAHPGPSLRVHTRRWPTCTTGPVRPRADGHVGHPRSGTRGRDWATPDRRPALW